MMASQGRPFPQKLRNAVSRLAASAVHWAEEDNPDDGWAVCEDTLKELRASKRDPGFEDAFDLMSCVSQEVVRCGGAKEEGPPLDAETFAGILTETLALPFERFAFAVDFAAQSGGHQFRADWLIGGPHDLSMTVRDTKDTSVMTLSGVVSAPLSDTSVSRVERVLDEFIGAMRAVGLCVFAVPPRPPQVARVHLTSAKGEEECHLGWPYDFRIASTKTSIPRNLSEIEQALLERGDAARALLRHARAIERLMAGDSQQTIAVRNACRAAVHADEAQDLGIRVTLAFSCLEALLLSHTSKDNVLARLAEAVAFSLASDAQERDRVRRRVKELYDIRSAFVHTGRSDPDFRVHLEVTELMYQVLRREIEMLPETGRAAPAGQF